MKAVVQRVKYASVMIENKIYSEIDNGLLIYLGIEDNDTIEDAIIYSNKIAKLRIFEDENEKMNKDIKTVNGTFLVVSQFTLYGDTKKGNRPSFIKAARPEVAIPIYEKFINNLKNNYIVKTGVFGANMQITSINDGPVTIIVENLK
ncbi:MAG TPA: D-tyrosyl-tRNA(Tyr) deacylase [Acholeplasmataceae bacterium]|nr:D-tyrosyl-tRNA(Tyr) deacylase [Acholeplasmataceae bacterium]